MTGLSGRIGQEPVAAAIVTSDLGVLIGRRVDGTPPWTFPSGKIEPGESPSAAAVREVMEEAGLAVRVTEVLGQRVHPETGRTLVYVAAESVCGTAVRVTAPAELAEVRWATLADAEALLAEMYEPVLDHLRSTLGA